MNESTIIQFQQRLQRVERQNRILVAILCAAAGCTAVAATKGGPTIITAEEVRTHRLFLLGNDGSVVHAWRGQNGYVIETHQ